MPLDAHLKGGERRLRVSTLVRIRNRCAGGGCPKSTKSKNRGHEPFCPRERSLTVGLRFLNPITGPLARGLKATGACPTTVHVIADDEDEDREARETEQCSLASEAAGIAPAPVGFATTPAPVVFAAKTPASASAALRASCAPAPCTPAPRKSVLLEVFIFVDSYKARTQVTRESPVTSVAEVHIPPPNNPGDQGDLDGLEGVASTLEHASNVAFLAACIDENGASHGDISMLKIYGRKVGAVCVSESAPQGAALAFASDGAPLRRRFHHISFVS